jgi:hypothetical protein
MADRNSDNYELAYTENAKVIGIFWEWRHKGMTYFSAGITALVALSGWLYTQGGFLRRSSFIPLVIGVGFSVASWLLDKRTAEILSRCYRVAERIELTKPELLGGEAIFSAIGKGQYKWPSYTTVLSAVYLASAGLLIVLSIALAIVGRW